jgi:endonuclease/exonuclease/phosphatase (EEP) superfamily protein YafD
VRLRTVFFWGALVLFLLPALALTAARVVQPSTATGIGLVAFSPYALLLYGAALIICVVGILVRVPSRRVWAAVALACVVGVGLHAWWVSPQFTGANPPPAADAAPIVVMSANLRLGEADGVDVVSTAAEEDVDLLVLQEVTPALLADMDRAGLADLLPERVGEAGASASGTMAFSRLPISEVVEVPTTFNGWEFVTGGLRVMAVHPTYPVDADGWAHDQAAIAHAVSDTDPDLVVGDLNATADHEALQSLADAGYRDAGELANDGWQRTWPSQGGFLPFISVPLVQIDHVLLGPRLASLGMHTADIPGSDHRAVVATVAAK